MNQAVGQPPLSAVVRRSCLRVSAALCVLALIAGLCVLYGLFVEPHWVRVKTVNLKKDHTIRLIHISDIHYKGDRRYFEKVIGIVNATPADLVCVTGDLVEEREFLQDCVTLLSRVNKPVYGVPGNHDVWAGLTPGEGEA